METSVSSKDSEWRPSHIPKLSYRKPHPSAEDPRPNKVVEGEGNLEKNCEITAAPKTETDKGKSVTSKQGSNTGKATSPTTGSSSTLSQKKKASILGGFFAKEASSKALEQFAAQLTAQHGELSPRSVPGVSSAKMPDYVPKVNSKWDGVPESVRLREKEEKEKEKQKRRDSRRLSINLTGRSQSLDSKERVKRSSTSDRGQSNSTLNSSECNASSVHQRETTYSPPSSVSQLSSQKPLASEQESKQPARPVSERSQSLRSPSGSSLPEITCLFPNDISAPPAVPGRHRNQVDKSPEVSQSKRAVTEECRYATSPDTLPGRSSSPMTALERSNITSSLSRSSHPETNITSFVRQSKVQDAVPGSNRSQTSRRPASTPIPKIQAEAFLAGEARPLELPDDAPTDVIDLHLRSLRRADQKSGTKFPRVQRDLEERPDTSRSRLGLRASMIIESGMTPWDGDEDSHISTSPKAVLPKGLARLSKEKGTK